MTSEREGFAVVHARVTLFCAAARLHRPPQNVEFANAVKLAVSGPAEATPCTD